MARAIDGSHVSDIIHTPCGSASWDTASGIAYRCDNCGCVLFSMAMPSCCRQLHIDNHEQDRLESILSKE
jgi:hypothetical protein